MRNRDPLFVTIGLLILVAACLALFLLSGCMNATATRTTKNPDGSTSTDSIKTTAFLENIQNGTYSNGAGMTLGVTSATPDQQSIAILSGAVVDLGKAAMLMARPLTNTVSTNSP